MEKLLPVHFIIADCLLALGRRQPVGEPPRFLEPLLAVFFRI
jgi:hypothetical protein